VKTRRDSITEYEAGGRGDAADKERAEIAIIERYLPQPLDEAALREAITALAAEVVPWIEEGVRRWPVATGDSKNGLNVSFSNEDGALTVILKGDEPYTYVLRWGSRDPFAQAAEVGKSAWATLFRSQAMRISKRIAKRVFGGGNG
jgi:hypothetical protein